ncbi:MAG: hypothetical protein KAS32_11085 [Candidatus Peribacteraceae bacterium]|nr:hypothetical protein [Candidatus Peribacteraceae bacterium]
MGSFNVTCSVSNVSLDCGDPAVYIPLEVSKHPYKIGDSNHMLIYPYCFYSPITLPLFGEYDDYGRLAIEEDENSDLVKSKFDIQRWDEMFDGMFPSGMFVHRDVFDALSSVCYNDYDGKREMPYYGVTSLNEEFHKHIEKLKKAIADEEQTRKTYKELGMEHDDSFYKEYSYWERTSISGGGIFSFREYKKFNETYQPQFLEGRFEEEVIKFLKFETGMVGTNNFYFPACNGYQHGNPWMSRVLYRTANKLMNTKIKARKDWD